MYATRRLVCPIWGFRTSAEVETAEKLRLSLIKLIGQFKPSDGTSGSAGRVTIRERERGNKERERERERKRVRE